MTASTRALLARLQIYRGDTVDEEMESRPLPQPPHQHPPLAADVVLTRRVALLQKRLHALEDENSGLRLELKAAETYAASRNLPTAAISLLDFQYLLEECGRAMHAEGEQVEGRTRTCDALVHALRQLYSLKSFMKALDGLHEAYRRLQRKGIELALENFVEEVSMDRVRTAAMELIMRFDILEERRTQSVDEYASLLRSFANAIGVAVSRAMLYFGKSGKESQQTPSLLSAMQQVVREALNVSRHVEEDAATSFTRNFGVNSTLLKRLHSMSLLMVPPHAAPTIMELQAMTGEVMNVELRHQDSCYDACALSLQTALSLLRD
ncbi:uncharacterized protein Tco025E_04468 [Trypanosoma conorhini]|uniref:Uncharacterized protein n=1 Tax=Trypanosoma conorhini TaxID=83891 RepID=A0A3R7NH32_9TRYP|nr:uncharacterized protein Tco025E_04468 [Trypanosoma conorhini]RNF18448.1 hypothetical protein Tco025E_04468 [Trypanosoma conorhini]